jgi:hypothetical protein
VIAPTRPLGPDPITTASYSAGADIRGQGRRSEPHSGVPGVEKGSPRLAGTVGGLTFVV